MSYTERLHLMTGQIMVGDVVLAHGMRVRIDKIRPYHPGGQGCMSDPLPSQLVSCDLAWACYGTVLNVTEATGEHGIPRSFLYDAERDNKGPGHGREDFWNVQGNNLAYWAVERTTGDQPIPDTAMNRRMRAGHLIRKGHELAGVMVYDGGGIWHMQRSCCTE